MKSIKKLMALVLALCLVLALTACGSKSTGESASPSGEKANPVKNGEKFDVAFLTWSLAEEFHVDVLEGAKKKAEELGINIVSPDPAGDMQKEIAIIEDLIQQKVDAIVIAPVDADAIVPYIKKARDAGIIVVDYDIDTQAEVNAKVLADNVAGGKIAAEYLIEQMGTKGKVLILEEVPGVTTAEERIKGFSDVMAQYPDIEIVRQLSTGTRDTHRATTENMLTAHPDIKGIFCFMGDNTLGAYAACQAMNRKDIKIAGYDATPEQLEIMKKDGPECQIISSVAMYPKAIGRVCIETVSKLLQGEQINGVVHTEQGLLKAKEVDSFVQKD